MKGSNWVVRCEYPTGEVITIPAVSESHANVLAVQTRKIVRHRVGNFVTVKAVDQKEKVS